jgi:hypothetical protein
MAKNRQMAKRSRRSTPYLTADNQMTRKPNLALNAEIESVAERRLRASFAENTRSRAWGYARLPLGELTG